MSYIIATKRDNLIIAAASGVAGANLYMDNQDPGKETQLWTFELTPIPGVFYIKLKASTNFITVPSFAKNGSSLTMEAKKGSYDSTQLWKFIPSSDGVNLLIQNYSLDGNGLVLDCNGGGVGKQLQLWSRNDNDNQKYYMSI